MCAIIHINVNDGGGSKAPVARIQRRIMGILAASESRSPKPTAKHELEFSGLIAFHVTKTNKA